MAKPIGPRCNLNCSYCFYLQKEALYPATPSFRMNDEVLEAYVRQYLDAHEGGEVQFAWQGGEPTLMGIDFFRRACALQRLHAGGKRVSNALQTNGTLLDDEWGRFLHEEKFLVGLSLDGPAALHDRQRRDRNDHGTFERVLAGLRTLQRHHVDYNLMTVVSAHNAAHPREVYRFLTGTGARHLQFIPLVEPVPGATGGDPIATTAASVTGRAWGRFLCGVFDEWIQKDVGRVFVQAIENAFAAWLGQPSSLCVHAETCGRALIVEHNGDVYACDHYVDGGHLRGNLRQSPLADMVDAPDQVAFGRAKQRTLPAVCRECRWRFACEGGCPKHRWAPPGRTEEANHLCSGYQQFFSHVDSPLREMAALFRRGDPPARIMRRWKRR